MSGSYCSREWRVWSEHRSGKWERRVNASGVGEAEPPLSPEKL